MSHLSFLDLPIEIAADSPRLEMISSRLKSSGMRPYPAAWPIDFAAPDPLLIDIATVSRDVLDALSRAEMAEAARQVVLIDLSGTSLPTGNTHIVLRRDRDLASLRARLTALARRSARQAEAHLRRETASQLGLRIPAVDLKTIPSLLYIGEGSPLFLSLQGPLRHRGIDLTAAISRETARRYMMERRFAAALVDLDSFRGDASATTLWIAEEQGLGALPLIAMAHPGLSLNDHQNTVISLATEIVDARGRMAEIVSMIEAACRRLSAMAPAMPRPDMVSSLTDMTSGLFSARFFEAHLVRQMQLAIQRAEPLSLLAFRLNPEIAAERPAIDALAGHVRAQIRDCDCPAAAEPGAFVISLPGTPYRGAVRLAERIAAAASENAPALEGRYGWRVVERRAYHTPQTFLGAALTGPLMRPRLAA